MKLSKEVIRQSVAKGLKFASNNAPTALVALGTGGFVMTVITACKATPQAVVALEEAKTAKGEDLDIFEKSAICAKYYWKPAIIGTVSLGCFIGSHSISLRRQAALSAAYSLSEKALKEYKDAVAEEIGGTKAEKIEDQIAVNRIQENPVLVSGSAVPGTGPLWIISWTNTPFRGNLEDIRQVINDLNDDLYKCKGKACLSGEITLNDVLYALSTTCGAPQIGSVSLGECFGFSADTTGPIDLDIRYGKSINGEPCGFINLKPEPLTQNLKDAYY